MGRVDADEELRLIHEILDRQKAPANPSASKRLSEFIWMVSSDIDELTKAALQGMADIANVQKSVTAETFQGAVKAYRLSDGWTQLPLPGFEKNA